MQIFHLFRTSNEIVVLGVSKTILIFQEDSYFSHKNGVFYTKYF